MTEPEPLSELEIIQNPALGAFALWRFGLGYQAETGSAASFLTAFLVLPALLHQPTLDVVSSTLRSSGLALFVAKLSERRELLLAFHIRAGLLRPLTIRSVAAGVDAQLLTVNYAAGTVRANQASLSRASKFIPEQVRPIGLAAEKLGSWLGRSGLAQAAVALRVEF